MYFTRKPLKVSLYNSDIPTNAAWNWVPQIIYGQSVIITIHFADPVIKSKFLLMLQVRLQQPPEVSSSALTVEELPELVWLSEVWGPEEEQKSSTDFFCSNICLSHRNSKYISGYWDSQRDHRKDLTSSYVITANPFLDQDHLFVVSLQLRKNKRSFPIKKCRTYSPRA